MRLLTRAVVVVLTTLVAAGLLVVSRPAPAVALDLEAAVAQASAYAASRGHQVGISIIDRDTGQVVENGLAHTRMRSASIPKVLVAESLIDRSRRGEIVLTQRDRDLMWAMVARSDDAAMSNLYSRFGGLDMVVRVIGKYDLTEIGGPPTPSYWGMYQITAHDIAKFYRGVLEGGLPPADRDLLVSLMRAATPTGADGFDQFFGIPRGLPYQYWGVKQGWMCCQEGMRRLHTTGILGPDNRFAVAILGQAPQSQSYAALAQTLTTVVQVLFPGGQIPPSGATRIPFGSVDVVTQTAPGRVEVSGWTADPDSPAASLAVHAYLDGRLAAYGTADRARPDIAAALPGYGAGHGWSLTVPVPDGQHQLCVYAINTGPGTHNPSLGCRTVEARTDPTGNFESAASTGLRGMTVAGWSVDPDAPSVSTEVRLTIDGQAGPTLRADQVRPDVGAAVTGAGPAHGFSATVPMAWPGQHTICAYAVNVPGSAGADRLLTCRVVVGPTGLVGQLDEIVVGTGSVTARGWVLDAVRVSDTVGVHVYVDGVYAGAWSADQQRPDVGAAFPEAGARHGLAVTVPVAAGPRVVCVFGIYADSRAANPALGCRQVVVP